MTEIKFSKWPRLSIVRHIHFFFLTLSCLEVLGITEPPKKLFTLTWKLKGTLNSDRNDRNKVFKMAPTFSCETFTFFLTLSCLEVLGITEPSKKLFTLTWKLKGTLNSDRNDRNKFSKWPRLSIVRHRRKNYKKEQEVKPLPCELTKNKVPVIMSRTFKFG